MSDDALLKALNRLAHEHRFLRLLAVAAATWLIWPMALVATTLAWSRRALPLLLLSLVFAYVLNYAIGHFVVFRERPLTGVERLIGSPWSAKSFPSDHAAAAAVFALVVFFVAPRWSLPMGLAALAVGLGRIAAGVHYPLDTLGGFSVGVLAVWLARLLTRFL